MNERDNFRRGDYLVVIDELTIWRAIRLARNGHAVYHFRTEPVFSICAPLLNRLIRQMKVRGLIRDAATIVPDASIMMSRMRLFGSLGWYGKVEKRFFSDVGLDSPPGDPFDMVFPLKKQTANYIADHFDALFFVHQLRASGAAVPTLVFGNPAAQGLVAAATGDDHAYPVETVGGGRWLNPLIALVMLMATTAYILRRTTPWARDKIHRFVGVDGTDNVRRTLRPIESVLCTDISNSVLVVFRNRDYQRRLTAAYSPLPVVCEKDGVFGIRQAAAAIWASLRQCLHLRSWFHLYPVHFMMAAKIVHLRNIYDGFLNRHHFNVFMSYDEYNADHILRTEALRRRGIRSVAQINGVNVFKVDYAFRYIDYDAAYAISAEPMVQFNAATWRRPESVKGFGTMGLSREELLRVPAPRPPDILCFAKPWFDGPLLPRMMVEVAKAFPDRRVTIAAKQSSKRFGGYEEYEEIVRGGPPNLALSDEKSFQLILRHRYCLCSESSILAEAMELRCVSFFLDIHDPRHILIYRDYKSVCVRSASDIVDRIKSIERGSWGYPWNELGPLIKLSDDSVYDLVRQDWGLPPLPLTSATSCVA